jgi:hypothetical protein
VGATEYKVKWVGLSSAHSKYMTEEVCKQTFGEATFGELLDDWNKWAHVEEEWVCRGTWARVTIARLLTLITATFQVGDPLPAEVAAARWPKRERPGVVNYEAVIVCFFPPPAPPVAQLRPYSIALPINRHAIFIAWGIMRLR